METTDTDCLKQLDNLLAAGDQSWLFGAGISLGANIPLMRPLTTRVFAMANEEPVKRVKEVLDAVKALLPDDSHIEHILSHLVDFAAIAERSKTKIVQVGGDTLKLEELQDVHAKVLKWIAETIRWGFVPKTGNDAEQIGSRGNGRLSYARTRRTQNRPSPHPRLRAGDRLAVCAARGGGGAARLPPSPLPSP